MLMINQPFNGQLGDILISQMQQPFNNLTIISAFAKNSGVLRLKPSMEQFSQKGGSINAYIGLDAYGTSYEALLNLFNICDSLYVIHSESPTTTFHSKIYSLSTGKKMWLAVGSNNLTGGGLWTNFESASCFEISATSAEDQEYRSAYFDLIRQYENIDYGCSRRISCEEDLLELLNADYVRTEVQIQMNSGGARRQHRGGNTYPSFFGTHHGIHIPRIQHQHTGSIIRTRSTNRPIRATHVITETNLTERIWFETKAMTGGSRNILDLSKLGTVYAGTPEGSRYETDAPEFMLGGVAFFDLEPEDTAAEKDITINYNGEDYSPCTIKFASNNGSWRIQLKGDNSEGTYKLHTIGGPEWLVHTLLIFEKITTDYYCLSVVDEDELDILQEHSYVVAHNGAGSSSKLFGLLY